MKVPGLNGSIRRNENTKRVSWEVRLTVHSETEARRALRAMNDELRRMEPSEVQAYDEDWDREAEAVVDYYSGYFVSCDWLQPMLINLRLRRLQHEWDEERNGCDFWTVVLGELKEAFLSEEEEDEGLSYSEFLETWGYGFWWPEHFWKCPYCGRRWEASLAERLCLSSTCPSCERYGYSEEELSGSERDIRNGAEFPVFPENPNESDRIIAKDDITYYLSTPLFVDYEGDWGKFIKSLRGNIGTEYDGTLMAWDLRENRANPFELTSGMAEKVSWKCAVCGHKFQRTLNSIFARGQVNRCPRCKTDTFSFSHTEEELEAARSHVSKFDKRIGSSSFVDEQGNEKGCQQAELSASLLDAYPELASEWHLTKNSGLGPADIVPGSSRKVWWLGKCGHEWEAKVVQRTKDGSGCPYCSGRRLLPGFNDLATKFPEVAAEWNVGRTGRKASEVRFNENKKGWFTCSCCHGEYEAEIKRRTVQRKGCPYCSGQKVLKGFNDLATIAPELMLDWDFEANTVWPDEVIGTGGRKNFKFKCSNPECGQSWEAPINHLHRSGIPCPYCRKNLSYVVSGLKRRVLEEGASDELDKVDATHLIEHYKAAGKKKLEEKRRGQR